MSEAPAPGDRGGARAFTPVASDPAAFQQAFGALLADRAPPVGDPALARALTIHRNTAHKAAQDALAANYPVVRALVGEAPFAACAAAYVDAFPPSTPRLCVYGEGFDAFLAGYDAFADLAYLPETGALERLCIEALFAADAPALDGAAFADGVDPDARLALHPAARRLDAQAPVAAIWLAHQPEAEPDALDAIAWQPQAVLVTRPEGRVQVVALDPAAAAFLAVVAKGGVSGAALGDAAMAAAEHGDLAAAFSTLLLAGALVSPNG